MEALARTNAAEQSTVRCRALLIMGQLSCFMGTYTEARGYLEQSVAAARDLADTKLLVAGLQHLGMACHGQGEAILARKYLEEALGLAQALQDKHELVGACNALAQLYRAEGEPDSAIPLYEKVVVLARELGDNENIAIGLLNLAIVFIGRGTPAPASQMLLEVLKIAEQIGSMPALQSAFEVSAGLWASSERWRLAGRFFGAAEALAQRTGLHRDPSDEKFIAPLIAKAQLAAGATSFAVAVAAGRQLTHQQAMLELQEALVAER
jgi:tetratricopeptide (TPR) repeat protein